MSRVRIPTRQPGRPKEFESGAVKRFTFYLPEELETLIMRHASVAGVNRSRFLRDHLEKTLVSVELK